MHLNPDPDLFFADLRQKGLLGFALALVQLLLLLLVEELLRRGGNPLVVFDDGSARLDAGGQRRRRVRRRRHDERHQLLLTTLGDGASADQEGQHEDSEADQRAGDDEEDVGRGEDDGLLRLCRRRRVGLDALDDGGVVFRDRGDHWRQLAVADGVAAQVVVVLIHVLAVVLVQEVVLLAAGHRSSRLGLLLLDGDFRFVLLNEVDVVFGRRRRCRDVVIVVIIVIIVVVVRINFLLLGVDDLFQVVVVATVSLLVGDLFDVLVAVDASSGRDVEVVVVVVVVLVVIVTRAFKIKAERENPRLRRIIGVISLAGLGFTIATLTTHYQTN